MKDYYKILELPCNACATRIKKSYRKLALKYHPDRNSSEEAEFLFKNISEAYSVLKNPQKKAEYDRKRKLFFNEPQTYTYSSEKKHKKKTKTYPKTYQTKQSPKSHFVKKVKNYSVVSTLNFIFSLNFCLNFSFCLPYLSSHVQEPSSWIWFVKFSSSLFASLYFTKKIDLIRKWISKSLPDRFHLSNFSKVILHFFFLSTLLKYLMHRSIFSANEVQILLTCAYITWLINVVATLVTAKIVSSFDKDFFDTVTTTFALLFHLFIVCLPTVFMLIYLQGIVFYKTPFYELNSFWISVLEESLLVGLCSFLYFFKTK